MKKASVSLEVTNACNLACIYCYARAGEKRARMPESTAFAALENALGGAGAIHLTFFGGEPTLNLPLIKRCVEFVEDSGIKTKFHISTNCTAGDSALEYLVGKNFSFNASCDGPPAVQDAQRPVKGGGQSSPLAESTIKKLARAGSLFKVHSTITSLNVSKMPDAVKYFAGLGAEFIQFEPVHVTGRALESGVKRPEASAFVENFGRALDAAEECGVTAFNSVYANLLWPCKRFCQVIAGAKYLVGVDGRLTLCYENLGCEKPAEEFVIGAVKHGKIIIDEEKSRRLRNHCVDKMPGCTACTARLICSGGCPYRNFTATGSITQSDPFQCELNHALVEEAARR